MQFPRSALLVETQIGSDHSPLVLDFGEEIHKSSLRFFFETSWFDAPGFGDLLKSNWDRLLAAPGRRRYCVDA
jgi:hypothetical protein